MLGFVLCGWILIGIVKVKLTDDWIIMIADRRNVRSTWLAFPVLILAWILWPFNIGRYSFLFIHHFGL